MIAPAPHTRRQLQAEALCAAAVRALTGDAALHYRGRHLHRGEQPLPMHAPHLRLDVERADFADYRAAADGMALRLLRSDADLHRHLCPADPVERLLFELFEQLRVETLVPDHMPGITANLHRRFTAWSRAFHRSGLTEGRGGILIYTIAQVCWSRLNARPVLAETEDHIESTRFSLGSRIGSALVGLRRHRTDQRQYADHALAIACIVAERLRAETLASRGDAGTAMDDEAAARGFALLLDFEPAEADRSGLMPVLTGHGKAFADAQHTYRAFTTRYDIEVPANTLVRTALLREYRAALDQRVAAQGLNLPRLARLFGSVLTVPQRDGWLFGEEEGRVDGRRLSQLVSSHTERRLFQREQCRPAAACLVSLLVDCSGSMKAHAEAVATLSDVLIRVLEMIGVRTELLGFTTRSWNGGRARQDWLARGRPPRPGRLSEICHLVFKDADLRWRRARPDIAALLKPDLFREGVDGEAVDWACNRLLARDASRRILVVISDGSPADGATALANDAFYLDNHLKAVVARHEQQGAVEILGLGVGLDLGAYFRRCIATDMRRALDNIVFLDIARLMARRTGHRAPRIR